MKLLDFYDVIEIAIKAIGKPAVFVCNHAMDQAVLMEFIREVNKRYPPEACRGLITETFEEGLVMFESLEEAGEFYSIWENETLFNSGLMAIMYDSEGKKVVANISGIEYD